MDYAGIGAAIACAVFWAKGAESENIVPLYWAGPSVIISALAVFALHWGWVGALCGNVAMFAAITAWRVLRDKGPDKG